MTVLTLHPASYLCGGWSDYNWSVLLAGQACSRAEWHIWYRWSDRKPRWHAWVFDLGASVKLQVYKTAVVVSSLRTDSLCHKQTQRLVCSVVRSIFLGFCFFKSVADCYMPKYQFVVLLIFQSRKKHTTVHNMLRELWKAEMMLR